MDNLPGTDNSEKLNAIIAACKAGDTKSQRALIQYFIGYVKSICLRYSSNNEDAEEMINDTFMKVFSNIDRYTSGQSFKAWIRTITVNTAIDRYRKNIRQPIFEKIENVQKEDVNQDIIESISADEILEMVRQLTPGYRIVFSMYAIDGYTHKEIAQKLGISEGTSKSNLQDARRKLKAMILKHNPGLFYAYELKNTTTNEE